MGNKIMTGDGTVLATTCGAKNLLGMIIDYSGATSGDVVAVREGGATGTVILRATIPAAAGTLCVPVPEGEISFGGGLYYSENAAAANKIHTNVIWK